MSRKRAMPVPTEAEVQKTCLAILEARGVLAWRSNSRVFRVPGVGGRERLMRAGLGKGSADVVGVLPGGRFLAVECKRPGGKPTPEQLAWLGTVNRVGGLGVWVDRPANLEFVLDRVAWADEQGLRLAARFNDDRNVVLGTEEVPAP